MEVSNTDSARSRPWLVPGLLAVLAVFGGLVVAPVWLRAARYCYSNYDFGIYVQALARLSLKDLNPWLSGRQLHIFNDHFDPVLLLVQPLAEVLPPFQAGLLAEALLVLLAVVPVLWLHATRRLGSAATLLLCAMLLLNSSVVDALSYPIHPTTWSVLPWVWLGVALHLRRPWLLLASLVLLFSCKEEFPFVGVVLAVGLWVRGERRLAVQVGVLSVAWLAFVFFARPWLFGQTQGYGSGLLIGLKEAPGAYVLKRLTAKGMASRLGSMVLLFVPVAVWAWRERLKPDWLLLALLLPMLGIRFLGMTWRLHYGAPVMAAALMVLLPLLAARRVPGWVLLATGVLLVTTNETNLRNAVRTLRGGDFPAHCPADPARLASVRKGVDFIAQAPEGKVLLGGNLLAHLGARDELYTVGGLQPPDAHAYTYVLVEKPPHGDPYPATRERLEELLTLWRAQPGTEVLMDDGWVFLARGRFTAAH